MQSVEELVKLVRSRTHQTYDHECHLTDLEACAVIASFESLQARIAELLDVGVLAEAAERAWNDCGFDTRLRTAAFNMIGRHMALHIPDVAREFAEARASCLLSGGLGEEEGGSSSATTDAGPDGPNETPRSAGVCRVDFDDDGRHVDDVAISGDLIKMFRLEAMGRGQFWANVSMLDGRGLRFWFDGSKARSLKVTAEWEGDCSAERSAHSPSEAGASAPATDAPISRAATEAEPAEADDAIGCAERDVGRYVYRRIEVLMDAKPGTADAAEITYLATLAEGVEELGAESCDGHPLATFPEPTSSAAPAALNIDALTKRFLGWPVPPTECADRCASMSDYKFPRSGTNFLSAESARQMFEYVLREPGSAVVSAAPEAEPSAVWRPIGTAAPNDGDVALLWFPAFPDCEEQIGVWIAYTEPFHGLLGEWRGRDNGDLFETVCDGWVFPTHWMPLPPPPTMEREGGR